MDIDLLRDVPGGPELVAWFGYAPRFHDAEMIGLHLDRKGASCSIRIHAFEMTEELSQTGHFVTAKHVIVTFLFGQLTEVDLEGFNHQNVVSGVHIEREPDAPFRMQIEPIYGLQGTIEGRALQISIEPGVPEGSQYRSLGI